MWDLNVSKIIYFYQIKYYIYNVLTYLGEIRIFGKSILLTRINKINIFIKL